VILRVDPEQGEDRFTEEFLKDAGQPHCRDGLVESIERASKDPRLLAGGNEVAARGRETLEAAAGYLRGRKKKGDGPLPSVSVEALVDLLSLVPVGLRIAETAVEEADQMGFPLEIVPNQEGP
jgi:hypothetical protein